jgi:hypothetical protein
MNQLQIITFFIMQTTMTLFNFNHNSDMSNWSIVDDVVMGGRSQGQFKINNAGNGLFYGDVSLENNGGFSMVQYRFDTLETYKYTKVSLRVKGDGLTYQFRIKENASDYFAFVATFETSKEWKTIEIPFNTMYPAFRGKKLNAPDFTGQQMEMIAFLIGNNKAQPFNLEIDKITLM